MHPPPPPPVQVNAFYALLGKLLDFLERDAAEIERQAVWQQLLQYTLLCVCIGVALVITVSAARAVTVPFMKLYSTSERLHKESHNLERQSAATGKFVPYATLELMGVQNIIELSVGRLVLRRLTIMFGDIIGFTTLATQLVPEDVFRWSPRADGRAAGHDPQRPQPKRVLPLARGRHTCT